MSALRQSMLRGARAITGAVIMLLLATCGRTPAEHVTLAEDLDALQNEFVADSGKVRAILLASPT